MLKCLIHELPNNIVIDNFYAQLTLPDKDYLDASCFGSFTHMKEDAKWKLLDRIQENAEGWENDKGRKSGINYDYECLFASIYSESLIKTTHQHLLLLVGFDTLIYRKYYDTPPILVVHHVSSGNR
jgi:hypothetical protein